MASNAVLRCNGRNSIVKPPCWSFFRVYSDLVASFANGGAVFFDDGHGNGLWLVVCLRLNAPLKGFGLMASIGVYFTPRNPASVNTTVKLDQLAAVLDEVTDVFFVIFIIFAKIAVC